MKSITRYLIVNMSIWALVVAFGSGLILAEFFRLSVSTAFDEQLDKSLKIIVGDLAVQLFSPMELVPPSNLGEPRFELPLSGWYWTVSNSDGTGTLLSSQSLGGEQFRIQSNSEKKYTGGIGRYANGIGPDGEKIRILEREISFGSDQKYIFRVTGNLSDIEVQIQSFQQKAWMIMIAFGAVLLVISYILVRSALHPLLLLQERVRDVTVGKRTSIEGDYPIEISGLVNEANNLIVTNRETLERARTQLGNLAHALKTPLSVINNEVRSSDHKQAKLLIQQTDIMRDQVHLYLERARVAASRDTIGSLTKVKPVLERLLGVMRKIHSDVSIDFHFAADDEIQFRGEQNDLEEMVGNLVDNACKWASSSLVVTVSSDCDKSSGARGQSRKKNTGGCFVISIEDDGPGLSQEEIEVAMQRGKRLDESKPGSGLGLSIVKETVGLYQGELVLSSTENGGLQAILKLPALQQED